MKKWFNTWFRLRPQRSDGLFTEGDVEFAYAAGVVTGLIAIGLAVGIVVVLF